MRSGRILAAATVALILTVVLLVVGGASASPTLPILGFQEGESPTALIGRDAAGLGSVGVDGVNLSGAPGAVGTPGAEDRAQLAAAHAAGLPAVFLVGNYSSKVEDFSEPLAFETLGSPSATAALATKLAGFVAAEGWDGISVDLESLKPRDRRGLTELLADLRADLGTAASLTVCVMDSSRTADYAAAGYDLPAIAESVDQVVLMAYDQHGPWERKPGPVGGEGWVRAGVHALLAKVPAAKVDLGVAGYGYAWEGDRTRMVSDAGARKLVAKVGARARWDAGAGEWTAALPGGGAIWWSDSRTLAHREALAASLGLHGLAVWSLGLSDPIG
jgi:spore germination protein